MINIISYEELLASIPVEFVLTDVEKDQLREKYDEEVEQLHKWTPKDLPTDSEQVEVHFGKFEEAGTQLIAFGWVKDRRIPWDQRRLELVRSEHIARRLCIRAGV